MLDLTTDQQCDPGQNCHLCKQCLLLQRDNYACFIKVLRLNELGCSVDAALEVSCVHFVAQGGSLVNVSPVYPLVYFSSSDRCLDSEITQNCHSFSATSSYRKRVCVYVFIYIKYVHIF